VAYASGHVAAGFSLSGWSTSPMLMEGFCGSDFPIYHKGCLLGLAEPETCGASQGACIFSLNVVPVSTLRLLTLGCLKRQPHGLARGYQ